MLAVLAWVSVMSLPGGTSRDRSTIGNLAKPAIAYSVSRRAELWHVLRRDDTWTVIAGPQDSADEITKAIVADPGRVAIVQVVRLNRANGFYDPIIRTHGTWVRGVFANGSLLTPDALRSLVTFLDEAGAWAPVLPESLNYTAGEATRETKEIRGLAIAHNAAASLVWIALPISLGWLPRLLRDLCEAKRLRSGLCPGCGYDRRATPPTVACPECGRAGAATPPA